MFASFALNDTLFPKDTTFKHRNEIAARLNDIFLIINIIKLAILY